jgi:hypothetical protein
MYAMKCTHLNVEYTLAGASAAIAALSLTRFEIGGAYVLKYTHLGIEHTLVGASTAVAAPSLTRYEIEEVYTLKCTHLSVEHTLAGAQHHLDRAHRAILKAGVGPSL